MQGFYNPRTMSPHNDRHAAAAAAKDEPAWFDDPNVLLRSRDLFPTPSQSPNARLNAVARAIGVVTLLVFAFTKSVGTLILGLVCAAGIALLLIVAYQSSQRHEQEEEEEERHHPGRSSSVQQREKAAAAAVPRRAAPKEGFVAAANASDALGADRENEHGSVLLAADAAAVDFLESTKAAIEGGDGAVQAPSIANPFGNLLMSDALLRPDRRAAPKLNTPAVREAVYAAMEAQVRALHPGTGERMFASDMDRMQFRQSLRPFFTNPSTTVVPDATGAWRAMMPNTGTMRDGGTEHGSVLRPRFKVGTPGKLAATAKASNFREAADILAPFAAAT